DADEQHNDADAGPDDRFAGGPVTDERLKRPVVGIRNVVAGASGGGGPCGPEDESRELVHAVRSADAACGNRIARLPCMKTCEKCARQASKARARTGSMRIVFVCGSY